MRLGRGERCNAVQSSVTGPALIWEASPRVLIAMEISVHGRSYPQLSEKSGISQSTLKNYFAGIGTPEDYLVARLRNLAARDYASVPEVIQDRVEQYLEEHSDN